MEARKYLLVIAAEGSPLLDAAAGLKELEEFRLTRAVTGKAGLAFIEGAPHLSLVAVDGSLVEDSTSFVNRIRDRHRDLPIIWTKAANDSPDFMGQQPSKVLDLPLAGKAFEEQVGELLSNDFYPKPILQGLISAANAVLALTCETAVDDAEPWLKQTETLPGNVHAFLSFMAEDASGHLLTSGDKEVLAALGERLGFDLEEGARQVAIDVAGEIGNQVLGRMKSICGDSLKGIRMQSPITWLGERIDAHFCSRKPNLCMELTTELGPIILDFGFHKLTVDDPNSLDEGFLAAGDVEFF